ncbi:unnamed protein product, partial [Staurois parvus]
GDGLSRVQWQSGGAEAASIEGHTQARLKRSHQQQCGETTIKCPMAEWRSREVSVVIADAMQRFYEVMPWVRRRSYTIVLPSIRRNNLRTGSFICPDPS